MSNNQRGQNNSRGGQRGGGGNFNQRGGQNEGQQPPAPQGTWQPAPPPPPGAWGARPMQNFNPQPGDFVPGQPFTPRSQQTQPAPAPMGPGDGSSFLEVRGSAQAFREFAAASGPVPSSGSGGGFQQFSERQFQRGGMSGGQSEGQYAGGYGRGNRGGQGAGYEDGSGGNGGGNFSNSGNFGRQNQGGRGRGYGDQRNYGDGYRDGHGFNSPRGRGNNRGRNDRGGFRGSHRQQHNPQGADQSDNNSPPALDLPEPRTEAEHPLVPVITVNTEDIRPDQLILASKAQNLKEKSESRATDVTEHMFLRGLRTGFGEKGERKEVLTNFFKITHRPALLFVYKLTFIRRFYEGDDGKDVPVYVKNKIEKQAVFAQMRQHAKLRDLTTEDCWVTDYDNIWSTQRLCDRQEFDIPDITVFDISATNPTTAKVIHVEEACLQFDRVMDLNKTVGQIFKMSTGGLKGEEDAAVLVRGLNAIATRNALQRAAAGNSNIISVGAGKFYDTQQNANLSSTLKALHGFAASVRPGAQNLLLNVSLKCSPFIKASTVYEYMRRRNFPGPGALAAGLKGVQVTIDAKIKPGLSLEQRRRVITSIGSPMDQQEIQDSEKSHGIVTVWHRYQNDLATGDKDTDNTMKRRFAVNVGGRPRKKGESKKKRDDKQDEPEWYPPQFLHILDDQLYRDKLASGQISRMIGTALKFPDIQVRDINQSGRPLFGIANPAFQTNLLNNFGMQIEPEMFKVKSRVLPCPTVMYAGTHANIREATWNLQATKVIKPCQTARVLILDLTELDISPSKGAGRAPKTGQSTTVAESSQQAQAAATAAPPDDGSSVADSAADGEVAGAGASYNEAFFDTLKQVMQNSGLDDSVVEGPYRPSASGDPTDISEARLQEVFEEFIPSDTPEEELRSITVVVMIPKQSAVLYTAIKRVGELKLGIKTICCDSTKLTPGNRIDARQYCGNIVLKLNIKGESDNHHIHKSWFKKLYDGDPLDETKDAVANTIVLGADVTHPMGHCAPGCPSIAAVVGSVDDHFAQFPGSMRLQRSRKETITELPEMIKERLIDWAAHHVGKLPTNVLFYRDGVSESQYDDVRKHEIGAVDEAFELAADYLKKHVMKDDNNLPDQTAVGEEKASDGNEPIIKEAPKVQADEKPKFNLTFVVVGKRHNTRFYVYNPPPPPPKEGEAGDQKQQEPEHNQKFKKGLKGKGPPRHSDYLNVTPGSVVDEGITHPYMFDFYLQSHKPIKGTGRSAHYVVLQNMMKLNPDELQNITHGFCYNYARATRGVSYCAPAYYAHRLCDRGRIYIRDWLTDGDNFHADKERSDFDTADEFNNYVVGFLHKALYYRPHQNKPSKYSDQETRQNPWHPSLDNTMFYL